MAYVKIHPIKSTVQRAINYIANQEKTNDGSLIYSADCQHQTAGKQFEKTRLENKTRGTVLARHLIQSFAPGETTPEIAHQIGLELCQNILGHDYEFVLATHSDRGHIHNHIIFNNVSHTKGNCYRSNKRSYHNIRYKSDRLCKKHGLSIIDEYYKEYTEKFKSRGKSWYEYDLHKQGKSWKSKLQFDIDRFILKANSWEEFLKLMTKAGYEIKYGKHIAFKHKSKNEKQRFTRARTIGEDYAEEILKERINNNKQTRAEQQTNKLKKIIDINKNEKAKTSTAYGRWAINYNLKAVTTSLRELNKMGIETMADIDRAIESSTKELSDAQDRLKENSNQLKQLTNDMENANIIKKYDSIYQHSIKHPDSKEFFTEYSNELQAYKNAREELIKGYQDQELPSTEKLLQKIEKLDSQRATLLKNYKEAKEKMKKIHEHGQNYKDYMRGEWRNKPDLKKE